jgi:hypothetical protein
MNNIRRIPSRPASEHPDDVAEAHRLFQEPIAKLQSLYELYSDWPGFERQYEALAAACDYATIHEDGTRSIDDVVADDLAKVAADRKADAQAARYDARRDEEAFGGRW